MKVSERKEFVGKFYLPSSPGRKIPGTLKIGLNEEGRNVEVRLEMSGNFETFPRDETPWHLPLINGDVSDVGCVTLLDCHYRNWTFGGQPKKNIIDARYALCNLDTEYKNKDEIQFNTLRFSVEHLNRWLGFVGVNYDGHPTDGMTIDYVLPKNITIKLSDGIETQFAFNAKWNLPRADGFKIDQIVYIKIASEQPRSLFYLTDLVGKINAFLCMALDEVVCIKDVIAPKDGHQSPIQIYYQSFVRTEKSRDWHLWGALCKFRDIEDNLTTILDGWLKNYELTRPTYSLYLLCRMGEAGYIENMFLSLVQALENMHEAAHVLYGWKKHKGLKEKLEKLIFTFKDLIADDQTTMWNEIIKDVVGVRNHLTHYSKTVSEFKEKSENPEIVYSLYQKLEAIIKLHFLKQIGFDNRKVEDHIKTGAGRLESEFRRPYHGEIKEAK